MLPSFYLNFGFIKKQFKLEVDVLENDGTYTRDMCEFDEDIDSNKDSSLFCIDLDNFSFMINVLKNEINYDFYIDSIYKGFISIFYNNELMCSNLNFDKKRLFLSLPILDYKFLVFNNNDIFRINEIPFNLPSNLNLNISNITNENNLKLDLDIIN
jgi:hypothetical protein